MPLGPDIVPKGRVLLTHEDYLDLPEDGKRYEIFDGELDVTPAPTVRHQLVLSRLFVALFAHVERHRLGVVLPAPTDLVLDDVNVVQPDLLFVSRARLSIVGERHLTAAPDLLVEVLSASTRCKDRGRKAALYAQHRAGWYWIVDPEERQVEEYRVEGGGYVQVSKRRPPDRFEPALFGGVSLDPEHLFAELA